MFDDHTLAYCEGDYNDARLNERAVEVPIAMQYVAQADPARVLEIGAVLPHYMAHTHIVVDRDEPGAGVINADVLTWEPDRVFDVIVSVSTLEHLYTWDEIQRAVERLKSWLAPGGRLFITLPYGKADADGLDVEQVARANLLGMTRQWRYDKQDGYEWTETALDRPWLPYGIPDYWAHSVYMAEYHRA